MTTRMPVDELGRRASEAVDRAMSTLDAPPPVDVLRRRLRRRRRRGVVVGSAGVLALAAVFVAGLTGDRDSPVIVDRPNPDVTTSETETVTAQPRETRPDSDVAERMSAPVPRREIIDEWAVVPLRLPDGARLELGFPGELDFTSHGFTSWVPAVRLPGFGRDAMVLYGPREQVRDRMDATVLDTYPDQRGGEVEFWRLEEDEVDHLAFAFGPWTVLYYDYREGGAGPRMTGKDRQLFAESLLGEVDEDGFLIVQATPPLEFFDEGAYAAGISVTGDAGTINITNARCDPYPDQPLRGPGDDYLHWCDQDTGFSVRVFAASDVLDAVESRIAVTGAR